jgi:hypothetical protein
MQHDYVDPRSGRQARHSDASPSTSTYTPPPPTLTLNMQAQPRPDNEEVDHDDMPILLKNEDHTLGDFLGWLPKY